MRFEPDYLQVAYFCSDLFAEPCAVSIASLFENNQSFREIDIYVISDDISVININRMKSIAKSYSRKLSVLPLPNPEEFFDDGRFSRKTLGHTFGRMIIGKLLPEEVTRVLCLDSDMLIVDSLYELWNIDLRGCYIAGVDSAPGKEMMKKTLHIEPGTLYCNGGMILMDLAAIRQDRVEIRYREYITNIFNSGRTLSAYEEEVINKCTYPKSLRLHPRYNLMTVNLVMDYDSFVKFRGAVSFYTREEMYQAVKHPAIIHAINTFYIKKRIWEKDTDSPYSSEYMSYRSKTPWNDIPQSEIDRSIKQRFMKKIWHVLPKNLSFYFAAVARNNIRPLLLKKRDDE